MWTTRRRARCPNAEDREWRDNGVDSHGHASSRHGSHCEMKGRRLQFEYVRCHLCCADRTSVLDKPQEKQTAGVSSLRVSSHMYSDRRARYAYNWAADAAEGGRAKIRHNLFAHSDNGSFSIDGLKGRKLLMITVRARENSLHPGAALQEGQTAERPLCAAVMRHVMCPAGASNIWRAGSTIS
jgi:hypothetical protein